jgi:hypothetical protein
MAEESGSRVVVDPPNPLPATTTIIHTALGLGMPFPSTGCFSSHHIYTVTQVVSAVAAGDFFVSGAKKLDTTMLTTDISKLISGKYNNGFVKDLVSSLDPRGEIEKVIQNRWEQFIIVTNATQLVLF